MPVAILQVAARFMIFFELIREPRALIGVDYLSSLH